MIKKQLIRDLKKDDLVNDIFVVKFKKPIEPYRNGYKFELRLGDSSKEIMCKYWGPQEEAKVRLLYDLIKPDSVVQVQGRVNEWNNQLEVSCNESDIIRVLGADEYDIKDFVRQSEKDIEIMYKELLARIASVEDIEIRIVLEKLFLDKIFSEEFKRCPAAMYKHHGWIGGLLEHTLSVVKLCEEIQRLHPKMRKDLLIAGAMLHDIGKMQEFAVTTSIRMTAEGMLLGHVLKGVEKLSEAMDEAKTPKTMRNKLLHIMITHMGEYGSSKKPTMPEALCVFLADQLDAQVTQMEDLKNNASTEDDFIYHKDFGNIYLK
ncbi:MAG: HD domain-containing protein [Candidatus Woesearchaeota archaeon]